MRANHRDVTVDRRHSPNWWPRSRPRGWAIAVWAASVLFAWPSASRAENGPVACFAPSPPGGVPGGTFGPCTSPDTIAHLPAVAGQPAITVSNFGFLTPAAAAGKVDYVCDDVFDRAAPDRIRRSPTGVLFIPSLKGLLSSPDGCTFSHGPAILASATILNVAFDAKSPKVMYALGGTPRVLWRSTDGGASFTVHYSFPADALLDGLVLPAGRTTEIYAFGPERPTSSPIWVSNDDGASFTIRDPGKGATTPPEAGLKFLAADPVRPDVLYFTVIRTTGDEVWRTLDGGLTASLVLRLRDGEAVAGLAFGATPNVIYIAGKAVFFETGRPPGRLYVTRDGGSTWLDPLVSPPEGPHYNCLTFDAGRLYACGTNRGTKQDSMLSVSADEGHTWQPAARLGDVEGPKACVVEACQDVARWLCNTYQQCSEGTAPPDASVPRDGATDAGAGRPDGGFAVTPEEDTCGCRLGGVPRQHSGGLAIFGVSIALMITSRAGRRRFRR